MKLRLSSEVRRAIKREPLVALETSVLVQGLPSPRNWEAALRCEAAVRQAGAIPAWTAVVDGTVCVGLAVGELQALAESKKVMKLGSGELSLAVAAGVNGATTVSAACEIAAAAGIRVFATGGIGGVHRQVILDWDISQDLAAIGRWPVAVVCAGAKSVLDLAKTLEVLETSGVPVLGVGTNELPGFYSRQTGLKLPFRVDTAAQAAKVMRARFNTLEQGGIVFALPPPQGTALPPREVEGHLKAALTQARREKIHGKALTPFLLKEMARRSSGRTVEANLDLLENNARFAGELAVAYRRK